MKKYKIAFVMGRMNLGGTEKALLSLLKYLDKSEYAVTLWVQDLKGVLQQDIPEWVEIREWGPEGIKVNQGTVDKLLWRMLSKYYIDDYEKNLKYFIRSEGYISDCQYDTVIAYYGYYSAVIYTALYNLKGKKKVLWVHGDYSRSQVVGPYWEKEYRRFDSIVCVSAAVKQIFSKRYSKLSEKTDVFHNVLDAETIRQIADTSLSVNLQEPSIVTVGRLSEEKGQDRIPEIVASLRRKGQIVHWYIIGDGPMRDCVEQRIYKNKVCSLVHMLGEKRNPYPFIKQCTVYVQPSNIEGYCLTSLEAKILGKAVIVTDVPGMDEQFTSGKDGLIVRNDNEALVEGVLEIINNTSLREAIENSNTPERIVGFNEEDFKRIVCINAENK